MLNVWSTTHVLFLFTTSAKAGEFLQPFTSGPTKDYSENVNYAVGVGIITPWQADFSNAKIVLYQDNHPGDAQGGPSRILEQGYIKTTWGWTVSYEGMDPAFNNVFYLSVSEADGSDSFTSHYFNISDTSTTSSAAATRTTSSAALSTTPIATITSSASRTSQAASQATVTVTPSTDSGTPIGTIAGMVIGIIIGTLILAAVA